MQSLRIVAVVSSLLCFTGGALAEGEWNYMDVVGANYLAYDEGDITRMLTVCDKQSLYSSLELASEDATAISERYLTTDDSGRDAYLSVSSDSADARDYEARLIRGDGASVAVHVEGQEAVYRLVDQLAGAQSTIAMSVRVEESRFGDFQFGARGTTAKVRQWKGACDRVYSPG